MKEKIYEEVIKILNGINYSQWKKIKMVVDNRFEEIKNESIFSGSEDTFENVEELFR